MQEDSEAGKTATPVMEERGTVGGQRSGCAPSHLSTLRGGRGNVSAGRAGLTDATA